MQISDNAFVNGVMCLVALGLVLVCCVIPGCLAQSGILVW